MKTRRDFLIETAVGAGILASSTYANAQADKQNSTEIVIYLYDGMTALDAIGVYEVLRFLPNSNVKFAAKNKGLINMDSRVLSINADFAIDEIGRADILVIPGGATTHLQMQAEEVVNWIKKIHQTTRWTTSVCTGSGLLLAAGILKNKETVTHWASKPYIETLGGIPSTKRVCQIGKIISSAGVSAGIDMALFLISKEANEELAKAIQLAIEYDPQPPFDSGSIEKASGETVKSAMSLLMENTKRANQR